MKPVLAHVREEGSGLNLLEGVRPQILPRTSEAKPPLEERRPPAHPRAEPGPPLSLPSRPWERRRERGLGILKRANVVHNRLPTKRSVVGSPS